MLDELRITTKVWWAWITGWFSLRDNSWTGCLYVAIIPYYSFPHPLKNYQSKAHFKTAEAWFRFSLRLRYTLRQSKMAGKLRSGTAPRWFSCLLKPPCGFSSLPSYWTPTPENHGWYMGFTDVWGDFSRVLRGTGIRIISQKNHPEIIGIYWDHWDHWIIYTWITCLTSI